MVGLKAKRYSLNSMSIHYCVKTPAALNPVHCFRQLIWTHYCLIPFLVFVYTDIALLKWPSGLFRLRVIFSQPVWITGLNRNWSEANTSQNYLDGNTLEKKQDTNKAMKCNAKLQLADKQAVLRLFIEKSRCKTHNHVFIRSVRW